MTTVVGGPGQTEAALPISEMPYPDCSARLRPHGHARTVTVLGLSDERLTVRPRRAGRAQVLLPATLSTRRTDTLEVIGTHMGRLLTTLRRWLRWVRQSHAHWLYEQAVRHAFRVNPDSVVRFKQWPSLLG